MTLRERGDRGHNKPVGAPPAQPCASAVCSKHDAYMETCTTGTHRSRPPTRSPSESPAISRDNTSSNRKCRDKRQRLPRHHTSASSSRPSQPGGASYHVYQVGQDALDLINVHTFHLHELQGDQEGIQRQLVCSEQQVPGRGKPGPRGLLTGHEHSEG